MAMAFETLLSLGWAGLVVKSIQCSRKGVLSIAIIVKSNWHSVSSERLIGGILGGRRSTPVDSRSQQKWGNGGHDKWLWVPSIRGG